VILYYALGVYSSLSGRAPLLWRRGFLQIEQDWFRLHSCWRIDGVGNQRHSGKSPLITQWMAGSVVVSIHSHKWLALVSERFPSQHATMLRLGVSRFKMPCKACYTSHQESIASSKLFSFKAAVGGKGSTITCEAIAFTFEVMERHRIELCQKRIEDSMLNTSEGDNLRC